MRWKLASAGDERSRSKDGSRKTRCQHRVEPNQLRGVEDLEEYAFPIPNEDFQVYVLFIRQNERERIRFRRAHRKNSHSVSYNELQLVRRY